MQDDMEVEAQDLAIDEIRELLIDAGTEISPEQAEHLAAFIVQAGGIEEALAILSQAGFPRDVERGSEAA
ncbi:MAG: hypothetical protein SFU86_24490 [Pirellulaceae bacterium]|nr:hypothetical protein [Pirellulaceae bacterium]